MRINLLIIILFPLAMFGQKNFAPINTEWNYEGHEIDCNGNHLNYKVEKEITIDDKDCSIIYAYHGDNNSNSFTKLADSLIIWENQNRVYFLEDTSFYLLIDFEAKVGDTITFYEPMF